MSSTYTTSVGALRKALKQVVTATGAKEAQIRFGLPFEKENPELHKKLVVDAGSSNGYACAHVAPTGFDHNYCSPFEVSIQAGLIATLLGHEAEDATVAFHPSSKGGAKMWVSGARIALREPEMTHKALYAQHYREMPFSPIGSMTGSDLHKFFRGPSAVMAHKDIRLSLCGVHICVQFPLTVQLQGTDGMSICRNQVNLETPMHMELLGFQAIIPAASAEAVKSVFGKGDNVQIGRAGENLVGFKTDELTWITNVINAPYPTTGAFFEPLTNINHHGQTVCVDRRALVQALQRMQALQGAGHHNVVMTFKGSGISIETVDAESIEFIKGFDMPSGNNGTNKYTVNAMLAITTVEAIGSDAVAISTSSDGLNRIYVQPAETTPDGEWKLIGKNAAQALFLPIKW